jgi:threonine/homoserine/homoserine lactone efflux protein
MISNNLAGDFGVLADTVEVVIAVIMILGGIYLTYMV